ncbi:MFS transporter [Streptomyces sp. NPDC086783]|uniref:MFS transporter n=1 Tax=Streptomyces sp. NPDC086783 TaxID=3365758 RepID=UPI00381CA7B0
MSARTTPPWPLVALFTAGYLAPYLLPTTVGRLDAGLPLSATQAGSIGSALLLSSAAAGFVLASRVDRLGPRRVARAGLLLAAVGYGTAALTTTVPVVVAGALAGGFGSGTATTVAATGIAAQRDPHRASTLGLLGVSALAGAVYLTVPHLGPGHGFPLLAIALVALLVWPATNRLNTNAPAGTTATATATTTATATARTSAHRPYPRAGLVLAGTMLLWSLAQNSLWGVSGRIGTAQAGLSEVTVGAVFAIALGAGLLGVIGAGALGPRLGRALPIGAGTAVIACCIAVSAAADDLTSFAAGEIAWNTVYPIVLSYLIGLAATMDPRGRWAVLVGSASSLGTACGPLAGSLLSASAGYPAMGRVLALGLLVIAAPMTAVALHTSGRRVLPSTVLRTHAARALTTRTPAGRARTPHTFAVRTHPAPEHPVVEIALDGIPAQRTAYDTAGPRQAAAPGPGPG